MSNPSVRIYLFRDMFHNGGSTEALWRDLSGFFAAVPSLTFVKSSLISSATRDIRTVPCLFQYLFRLLTVREHG